MKICNKCFQTQHDNYKCFPISHPTISINIDTNTPYSIILLVLQNAEIKIKRSSYSVMPQIAGIMETVEPSIEVSTSDEDEDEDEEEEEAEKKTQKKSLSKVKMSL